MSLVEQIRQYYFDNFEYLTPSKRFHFASRLAAWEGSVQAKQALVELKPLMVPKAGASTLKGLFEQPLGPVYADNLRRRYFEQYNLLHGANNMMFRVRHLKEIYGIDLSDDLLDIVKLNQLEELGQQLLADRLAVKWLSSFAVNCLYLLEKLDGVPLKLNPSWFLDLRNEYELKDPIQLNLLVYLFTHCIIAESNFYAQVIPASRLSIYIQMLETLDEVIGKYPGIRLDAKLEYLIASRICHKHAALEEKIYRLVEQSVSPKGYIIEKLKSPDNHELNDINTAEHRNVLYIMSTTAYWPKNARVV